MTGPMEDGGVLLEPGVVEQLLGLSTGTEDAQITPSEQAVELLLGPAVGLAARAVIDHGAGCNRPNTCPHVPPTLRRLLKAKPATVRASRTALTQALLRYPKHEMTDWVRGTWLEIEANDEPAPSVVGAIESREIFTAEGLHQDR